MVEELEDLIKAWTTAYTDQVGARQIIPRVSSVSLQLIYYISFIKHHS